MILFFLFRNWNKSWQKARKPRRLHKMTYYTQKTWNKVVTNTRHWNKSGPATRGREWMNLNQCRPYLMLRTIFYILIHTMWIGEEPNGWNISHVVRKSSASWCKSEILSENKVSGWSYKFWFMLVFKQTSAIKFRFRC